MDAANLLSKKIFQSFLAVFFMDFCAVLEGSREAKLMDATVDEILRIEADYANAGKTFQAAALLLLGGTLAATFGVLSVQNCCFQRGIGSLPGPYQYQLRRGN